MTRDSNLAVISPFVLVPETVKMTGCPRSSILKYSELGLFPPMVRLLGNRIAFIRADVQSWIDCRVASAKESGKIHRVGNYVLKGLPVGGVK
jgi:predicted DNA-binding transcriptional regulator AlpA